MIRISRIPEDEIYGLETTLGDHVITEKIPETTLGDHVITEKIPETTLGDHVITEKIPETVSDEGIKYFTIILDEEIVIVKVLFGNITIDVGGRLFTLLNKDYDLMVVL